MSTLVWLVLAATLARPDVVAAVSVGLLVALAVQLRDHVAEARFRMRARWLVHLPRLGVQVLHDLGLLGRALLHPRATPGVFRAVPFDGGGRDPIDVGRRALLTLAASLGPNTFVVDFDDDQHVMLVHQLVPHPQVLPVPDGTYPLQ